MSAVAPPAIAPWFEDLAVGQVFDAAPALTLTPGHAAVHQALVGDRLALALDMELSRRVVGGPLAHPALVWDVAIGQSTLATRRVRANLFYRGLAFRRFPLIGDTLRTATEVVALRQNRRRDGRPVTGLAVLRVRTVDQEDRPVLNFVRCAMLPLRDAHVDTGHAAELDGLGGELEPADLAGAVAGWDLAALRDRVPGGLSVDPDRTGDVVSAAPELARLTLNVAAAHHDAAAGARGRRLVYGGHTIGVAAAQAARAVPGMATIVAWHGCDHHAPVFEGDTLRSALDVEQIEPLRDGAALAHLRSRVTAEREGAGAVPVLDWRFVAVVV